eukprot:469154-Amphidinium_carterae.2
MGSAGAACPGTGKGAARHTKKRPARTSKSRAEPARAPKERMKPAVVTASVMRQSGEECADAADNR